MRPTRSAPVALLAAIACTTGGVPAGHEDAWLAFVHCLRERGVNVADPVVTADQVRIEPAAGRPLTPRPAFDAATRACRPVLTAAGIEPPGGPADPAAAAETERRALAFAACVRAAGFELPDPQMDGARVANWDPEALGIDLDDPWVRSTGDRCARASGFDPGLD